MGSEAEGTFALPPGVDAVVVGIVGTLTMDLVGMVLGKEGIVRVFAIGRWAG